MIKKVYGVSLDELGISLINNRGVGFESLASIFHASRVQKRCAIITDLDTYDAGNKFSTQDAEKLGKARKENLEEKFKDNEYVNAYFANYTFEVDFALAGQENIDQICNFAKENKYVVNSAFEKFKDKINSKDISKVAEASLEITDKDDVNIGKTGKGWSALVLCDYITKETIIPSYILKAVLFSMGGRISDDIKQQISDYRGAAFGNDAATRALIKLESGNE